MRCLVSHCESALRTEALGVTQLLRQPPSCRPEDHLAALQKDFMRRQPHYSRNIAEGSIVLAGAEDRASARGIATLGHRRHLQRTP
jgi:hypothetical protein